MEIRRNATVMHNFFTFDIIGCLTNASHQWESVVAANCPRQESTHQHQETTPINALTENLALFKQTAMEIFPTYIQEINAMPQQREGEVPSTAVNEITYSSLNFMRHLCEYADIVGPLLTKLGVGNWMMGSGGAPVLSLGLDGDSILSQYLCDVLAALLNALEARSRAIRQPSTASIFLFNNIGHIRREIARSDRESTSGLAACLGTTGSELIEGALRQANASYLDAWNPIVSAIIEDGVGLTSKSGSKITAMGGGGERAAVKDRFA